MVDTAVMANEIETETETEEETTIIPIARQNQHLQASSLTTSLFEDSACCIDSEDNSSSEEIGSPGNKTRPPEGKKSSMNNIQCSLVLAKKRISAVGSPFENNDFVTNFNSDLDGHNHNNNYTNNSLLGDKNDSDENNGDETQNKGDDKNENNKKNDDHQQHHVQKVQFNLLVKVIVTSRNSWHTLGEYYKVPGTQPSSKNHKPTKEKLDKIHYFQEHGTPKPMQVSSPPPSQPSNTISSVTKGLFSSTSSPSRWDNEW